MHQYDEYQSRTSKLIAAEQEKSTKIQDRMLKLFEQVDNLMKAESPRITACSMSGIPYFPTGPVLQKRRHGCRSSLSREEARSSSPKSEWWSFNGTVRIF